MADKPVWRSVFDQVIDEVGPRLSDATGSDGFADAVEVAEAVRVRAASELQRSSRRVLHTFNLPAGSDVAVMRQEIGSLNREVRALARMVEVLQDRLDAVAATAPAPDRAGSALVEVDDDTDGAEDGRFEEKAS